MATSITTPIHCVLQGGPESGRCVRMHPPNSEPLQVLRVPRGGYPLVPPYGGGGTWPKIGVSEYRLRDVEEVQGLRFARYTYQLESAV